MYTIHTKVMLHNNKQYLPPKIMRSFNTKFLHERSHYRINFIVHDAQWQISASLGSRNDHEESIVCQVASWHVGWASPTEIRIVNGKCHPIRNSKNLVGTRLYVKQEHHSFSHNCHPTLYMDTNVTLYLKHIKWKTPSFWFNLQINFGSTSNQPFELL